MQVSQKYIFNDNAQQTGIKDNNLKGTVHPKTRIVTSFIYPHFKRFSSAEHKRGFYQ